MRRLTANLDIEIIVDGSEYDFKSNSGLTAVEVAKADVENLKITNDKYKGYYSYAE